MKHISETVEQVDTGEIPAFMGQFMDAHKLYV